MKPSSSFATSPVIRQPGDAAAITAAGTIHDLGNLIQLATSAVGILGRSPEVSGGHLAPLATSARTSLERAGQLVRQSLDSARKVTEEPRTARLAECLVEVKASICDAAQTDISLDIRLAPGLPDLACDPLGLQCAVLNLVFNAREAMAGRGTIRLRAERSVDAPSMADLQVIDCGIGMSPETVARAFDPFFTTKSDGLGGIGLPMVERFARECGGAVFIESVPRVGTTVILRLPFATPAATLTKELDR